MCKIIRLFHTIRYLKLVQILYQIRYRIFKFSCPEIQCFKEINLDSLCILIPELDCCENYINRFYPKEILNNKIKFLAHEEIWKPGKWIYQNTTHLWNFNLHYFEYGVALASAYQKYDDLEYYRKFKEIYSDWHESNTYGKGDAWHPYTISIRIPNLLITMQLLRPALKKDKDFCVLLNQSIYKQYIFLQHNLEKNLLANHYFENLKTLYICSIYFKDKAVKLKIRKQLVKQLDEQILSDGMHFERSFMYHRIILEGLLRIYAVEANRKKNKEFILNNLKWMIERMTDCMYSLEKDMGKIPLFNDAGDGVAKKAESLLAAVNRVCNYVPIFRRSFPKAGYYKLQNQYFTILFDGGILGPSYMLGHAHCDTLSFELAISQVPVFVNAGTYQYQIPERSFFRSVKAHNTIQCGNIEPAECWGEHRAGRRITKVYGCSKNINRCEGNYKGYHGETVKREIVMSGRTISFIDSVEKSKEKIIHSYYHIHPECRVVQIGNSFSISLPNNETKILFTSESGKIAVHRDGELVQYSEQFGKKQAGTTLEVIHNVMRYTTKIQII